MKKQKNKILTWLHNHLAIWMVLGVALLCTVFIVVGTPAENGSITLDGKPAKIDEATEEFIAEAKIEMGKQVKAMIQLDGTEEFIDVPTVESIDSGSPVDECPADQDCGQGWYVPTNSPSAFKNATNGQCINTDGYYGSQCWDLGDLFWRNYAGRGFNTCGTGAAKGTIQDGCWQKNAGNNFNMIWDKTKIQAGDWIITSGGQYGHVCMALGGYNNGYVSCFGTNQGGAACSGGGAVANTINMNLSAFAGAFRPKTWETPTPSPDPTPTPTPTPSATSYTVQRGDTLGEIALKNGWWNSSNGLFGDTGYAQRLADFNGIKNRGLIFPNQVIKRAE